MPNYCNYDMHISGAKDKIFKLCDWLRADYSYEPTVSCKSSRPSCVLPKYETEHHIGFRNFQFLYDDQWLDEESGDITLYGNGYCAWSVHACMFDTPHSYLDENKNLENSNAISLVQACEALDLKVELFSWEPEMSFAEHCIIDKGNTVVDECATYYELTEDDVDDYKEYGLTKEDAEKLKAKFMTMAEGESICVCAYLTTYGDWNWNII